MVLVFLIAGPIIGAILSLALGRLGRNWARIWPLIFFVLDAILLLVVCFAGDPSRSVHSGYHFYAEISIPWIRVFGISFHLALDGLSLVLAFLTVFLGIVAVIYAWRRGRDRGPFFYFNISLVIAGVLGTFLAVDLFLFFLFWELMLVPTYFLIVGWGESGDPAERRRSAAGFKFFVFTQISGLIMLVAILALYFIHGVSTGFYTFDFFVLLHTHLSPQASMLLMLGFLIAFAVKLPVVPLHSWLPDSYTEAPVEGTIVLAGLLSKAGAYGIFRFILPLFHEAAVRIAPIMFVLGVIGIIYGAFLAFSQSDLKRLIAYSSVSHLGFILVGIFSMNQTAMQGAVLLMISHGVATSGLFLAAAFIEDRLGTRDLNRMGGLFGIVPKLGGAGTVFALIALGVPGSGNFLAEILIIVGTFQAHPVIAILTATGMIFSVAYALWIIQKALHGPRNFPEGGVSNAGAPKLHDLSSAELLVSLVMILAVFWIGLYPQPIVNVVSGFLQHLPGGIS